MDNNYNIWRLLWDSICISMTQEEIQQIISYAYPKIQKYYGKGKLPFPKIDTSHKNTYAMHSGESEAEGEHAATSIAEYYEGTIYLS